MDSSAHTQKAVSSVADGTFIYPGDVVHRLGEGQVVFSRELVFTVS